jgi:DNA polymerase-3 subunit delta
MKEAAAFSPLYLVHGEERFLMEEVHRRFLSTLVDPATQPFNYTPFNGEEAKADEILASAQTLPVFSQKRLVWVWDADRIEAVESERFLDYLERPAPDTVLVFAAAKPDFRKKLFVRLRSKGKLIPCAPLSEREIPRWIAERAKGMGLPLSEEVILYLKERMGNNLHGLLNEIEKIRLIAGGKSDLSVDDLKDLVVGSRGRSVFDWLRPVGEKNLSLSLSRLNELLDDGEHPLLLLTMLARQLRQMACAKEHLARRGNPSELPRLLRFPPTVLQPFLQQLKRWTAEEIAEGLALCLETDLQLKGGALPGPRLLEGLLFDLCGKSGARYTPKELAPD